MPKQNLEHIRHHANEHHSAHLHVKNLIKENHKPKKDKFFTTFLITFFIIFLSIIIFRNWGNIINFMQNQVAGVFNSDQINTNDVKNASLAENSTVITNGGLKKGVQATYQIDKQVSITSNSILDTIITFGGIKATQANASLGEAKGVRPADIVGTLKTSVWITNYLSTGQYLTTMQQNQTKALQKSIIATYYLGEKTITIDSTLQTDAQILSKIKNVLSIDLFQYLDQTNSRADALDDYIGLLKTLQAKTNKRIADLQEKIVFLEANSKTRATDIKTSEQTFFNNLNIFDGQNADQELKKFIGLKDDYNEIRAKLGAYKSLQNYYKFFKPKLDTMLTAVQANRDVLIAGVKVTEVQNMTLPLVIKSK